MKKVLLRDICKIEKGKQIDTNLLDATNKYKYINGGIKESGMYFKFNTNANTVIVSEGGVSCGYVNYVEENFWCGCHCYRLLNPTIEPKYLYYVLKGNQKKIMDLKTGAAMPNIKKSSFQSLVLSIDNNKKHQDEIIYNLDKISSTIKLKTNQLILLDELIKSRFIEMFGDPNVNPKKWPNGKINDIAKCVVGATPKTSIDEYWNNGTIPWLSSGEVNKYKIYDTDKKITQLGYKHASAKMIPAHTVVLAIAGQGKTRGTVAISEIELCTNQSICSLVNNSKVNAEFLLFYLKFQYDELRMASNGAKGRGGLNLKIIGAFPIFIPPMELQNKFAELVKQVDKLKFIVQEQINNLQELFDKKMDEYFGE